jgi:AcrR family transcriptional regulator
MNRRHSLRYGYPVIMTAATQPPPGQAQRPLRRDAERNRQRILRAAAEVFSQRGLDATLDDVARHAGVGVGTVYRRFPDKQALIAELFTGRIDELAAAAERASQAADPWAGLTWFLEHAAETMSGDLGLRQMMQLATYAKDQVGYARERMRPVIDRLVTRAQAAGQLRGDFSATDVPVIAFMLASAAEYGAPAQPGMWRRYLTLITDSLRPARDGVTPLPLPAMTPEQVGQAILAHGARLGGRHHPPGSPGAM